MKKIVVAGATGYLGSHIITELQRTAVDVKALGRNQEKLENLGLRKDQLILSTITDPSTLVGVFQGVDVVISTVGITRQKDGLTYLEVDYQANMNLLEAALNAGVSKFIYVSVLNGEQMRHLKIMEAKEKFVDALKASGLKYSIIRPNGFFSDMKDFLDMGNRGIIFLFGHGNFKLNPIHGMDLARYILETIELSNRELPIGGPDILTQNEIAALSLAAWKRPLKIVHLPDWIRKFLINGMRTFTSVTTYGPIEFFLTMMGQDNIAPRYGERRLQAFFVKEVDQLSSKP